VALASPASADRGSANAQERMVMVEIDVVYEGALRSTAHHGPSGASLNTDAPLDNHGRGQSFSPTDLVATGLGTCMATVMGILARKEGWDIDGLRVRVVKQMIAQPVRRIGRLTTTLSLAPEKAARLTPEARARLAHAAETCPVRMSLLDAIEVPIHFEWGA
jgi:putative redox protein